MIARLRLLVYMALRSLWSHKVKSLIVGSLMAFGTLLVVLGTGLLDSIESSIERSVVNSLSGHLQVYAGTGRDSLALFGDMTMGGSDWGEIDDFATLRETIERVPGVEAVVPMGINTAYMTRGSDLERVLGAMRQAVREGDRAEARAQIPRARRLIGLLRADLDNQLAISDPERAVTLRADLDRIDRASTDDFWAAFADDAAPDAATEALELLDTRVAPLAGEGQVMFIRYVGTDLPQFARHFDRLRVVRGEMVPEGRRGILINQKYADRVLKLTAARLLDDLDDARLAEVTIAGNAELTAKARRLRGQGGAITLMLSPDDATALEAELRAALPGVEGDLDALIEALLTVDDATLAERFRLFHDKVAPRIELYPFNVGDVVTIRAWTKSGALEAVNVRVWGTFVFDGMERSELTGAANLIDLVTFRELYGQMTADDRAELDAIRADVGAEFVDRDSAEDALFGGGDDDGGDSPVEATAADDFDAVGAGLQRAPRAAVDEEFDPAINKQGLVLNAAVMLRDGDRLTEAQDAITQAIADAGLTAKVVDWRAASGVVGQLATLVRIILYIAIFIIFAVALVIINNSMLMATMERVREIGTLRAIGAQRRFVMQMFLLETLVLGLLAGLVGALAGAGVIAWLGSVGIPAANEIMVFIFSGNRLYPTVGAEHIALALVIILVASLISTWYPARVATRIEPIEAMRGAE